MPYPPQIAEKIVAREDFDTPQIVGYTTKGGTFILASPPILNDDDVFHDLVAITPTGDVFPLRLTANIVPAVEALRGITE